MADEKFDVDFEDVDFEEVEEDEEVVEEEKEEFEPEQEANVEFDEGGNVPAEKETKNEVDVVDDSNPLASIKLDTKIQGSQLGAIGDKVSRYPIEKMRFTKAKKELISIMLDKPFQLRVHYHENTGSFRCFEGACCKKLKLPRVRYVFPIVVYDTNKKGKPVSKEVTVKALQLGQGLYDDIITIREMHGDISNIDLLVTCKDEQYQRLSFTPAGKARWRRSGEITKYVLDFWKDNNEYLFDGIAREMDEEQFKEEMDLSDVNTQIDSDDFDDAFDE